ncbi:MAG: YifB family Mg chelatase-like AAA ATPase [Bacteroidota bacterium]|jgi:magnesium chelatase family protein
MFVKTFGFALHGVEALKITIEINVINGAYFNIVGLPDNAVKESQQRVFSALKNNGFSIPVKGITINLAPADVRKEGACYDLPIAAVLLAATGQIPHEMLEEHMIMGELSLDGEVRPVRGVLPFVESCKREGITKAILPIQNLDEASLISGVQVIGVKSIKEVVDYLKNPSQIPNNQNNHSGKKIEAVNFDSVEGLDFAEVKGQENIKRALEIAAAGGHNLILIGPPGSGKTMLSRRLPSIMPPLSVEESLETTKIHSVAGKTSAIKGLIKTRPFRNPHHTISDVALVGGGSNPKPGEISLAHHGVLFLDELPEFKRSALEVLRQPIEERKVTISRSKFCVDYPSNFMLVASMNPCPCGFYTHPEKDCTCAPGQVSKYLNKISGPLMDRIDLHVEVNPVPISDLSNKSSGENSEQILIRVTKARAIQQKRFKPRTGCFLNSQMQPSEISLYCDLDAGSKSILEIAMKKLKLSARAYERILKVSRTIADLDNQDKINSSHIAEAIQYRTLDRENWAT